jgi:hypothetical protein
MDKALKLAIIAAASLFLAGSATSILRIIVQSTAGLASADRSKTSGYAKTTK